MNKNLIVSFLTLRRAIGIIGILMGFLVVILGLIQSHFIHFCISDYYWTNVHDFFVGIMICVGIFLLCYKGYEKIDTVINSITGACGIGLGLFPDNYFFSRIGIFNLPSEITIYFHLVFAIGFFLLLAYNSYFLFTKSKDSSGHENSIFEMTNQKLQRNKIYRICGIVILSTIVGDGIYMAFFQQEYPGVLSLILETIMLIAFGFSWLIKGETLFKDEV